MRIFFLLLASYFLLLGQGKTQNPLEDAIFLRQFLEHKENNKSFELLKDSSEKFILTFKNYIDGSELSEEVFGDIINKNPFFCFGSDSCAINLGALVTAKELPHIPSNQYQDQSQNQLLPFPIEPIVDGFSKFLVTRTKEELNTLFFKKLSETFRKNKKIIILFPGTAELLLYIESDIFKYKQFLEDLRYSFNRDLQNLPNNLTYWLLNSRANIDNIYIQDVLHATDMILKGSWDDIFKYLGEDAYIHTFIEKNKDSSSLILLSDNLKATFFLSSSIEYNTPIDSFYSFREIFNHLSDQGTMYLYLGLMWELGKKLSPDGRKAFENYIENSIKEDSNKFREEYIPLLQRLSFQRKQMDDTFDKLKKNHSLDSLHLADYQVLFDDIFRYMEQGDSLSKNVLCSSSKDCLKNGTNQFLGTFRKFAYLNLHSRLKNYSQAFFYALDIVAHIEQNKLTKEDRALKNIGLFAAQLASSKTSDEVAIVVENFALPPKSALYKKSSDFMISLNAYTGLFAGSEKLYKYGGGKSIYGITAPIGLEASYSLKKNWNVSLFFPFIDIGAVTALRFNDNTSILPEFKLDNIVAPGAYLVFGLRNVPISIGAGWQNGPQLRKVLSNGTAEFAASGSRLSLFVGVDIPLLFLKG